MNTQVIKIDPDSIDLRKIKQAAEVIDQGGIVAFPTETVYGLGADYLNQKAVQRIYAVKKRSPEKALTVQIENISYLDRFNCRIPALAYQLMSKFWPGPLTIIFSKNDDETLGLRIPDNPIALELIKAGKNPIVAPSANISGLPAARTAEEVLQSFSGLIEMVIDGGNSRLGVASTVLDLSSFPYKVLREGAIRKKELGIG